MKQTVVSALRIAAGVVLVIIGIFGLVLPILQGILIILLGLALLSVDIPAVRRLRERLLRYIRDKRGGRR